MLNPSDTTFPETLYIYMRNHKLYRICKSENKKGQLR